MEWYHYVLIVVGVLLLAGVLFGIYYGVSVSKKNKTDKQAIGYYVKIIDAMGGIDNINDVMVVSSRLSLVLKDNSLIKEEKLQSIKDDGVGVVKSSKKITLVIGEMAQKYCEAILKLKDN